MVRDGGKRRKMGGHNQELKVWLEMEEHSQILGGFERDEGALRKRVAQKDRVHCQRWEAQREIRGYGQR